MWYLDTAWENSSSSRHVNDLLLIICVFVSCVSHAFASVLCCLVSTCWERADLLALVGDVCCIFVTFPCGIQRQVWYLIVSFPDPPSLRINLIKLTDY